MSKRWPIVAGAALLLVGSAVLGTLLGTGAAPSQQQANRLGEESYELAFKESFRISFPRGREEGLALGKAQGKKRGAKAGTSRGASAGSEGASAELAAIEAEQEAAASPPLSCQPGGPCFQISPGGGGAPCPPGTVENGTGVLCLPEGGF